MALGEYFIPHRSGPTLRKAGNLPIFITEPPVSISALDETKTPKLP
jgi:hypothetical protein